MNAVREKQQGKTKESTSESMKHACYRCANVGHFGRDPECPARGKTAISVEEKTILVSSVKQRKQPNLPNLDVEGSQKERIQRENQLGMWKVKEGKMSMHLL